MKLVSLLLLGSAAAAGFGAARTLLGRDEAPQGLPGPAQKPVDSAYGRLHRLKEITAEAIEAGREERAAAERELRADYLMRSGRTASSIPESTARLS
jgi:hypothetical protein